MEQPADSADRRHDRAAGALPSGDRSSRRPGKAVCRPPDAGIATSIIALIASAGAEAAGVANDATRGLSAITNDVLDDMTVKNEEIADHIRDIEEELANRLDRGREDFDSYLTQAADRGLTVHGKVVMEPTTDLSACPAPDAGPQLTAEWDDFISKVTTYNDLATRVGTWWGELETWCSENFAPLIACLGDLSPLDGLLGELSATDPNKTVVDAALETADARTERDLAEWRTLAQQMQTDADTFTDQLRSGNPATHAAAEAANPRAIREGMEELLDHVEQVSRIGKIIPIVGPAIEIVTIGAAIAWVPVDARESIDEWLEDGTRFWQPPQLAG